MKDGHMSNPQTTAPMYWEDAAYGVLDEYETTQPNFSLGLGPITEVASILAEYKTFMRNQTDDEAVTTLMRATLDGPVKRHRNTHPNTHPSQVERLAVCARKHWFEIAYLAMQHEAAPATIYEVHDLITSKQHDYGHDNINAHGLLGIEVRLSDKIARLQNLNRKQTPPEHETVIDTIADIIGYCVIAVMFTDGTFQLDTEPF